MILLFEQSKLEDILIFPYTSWKHGILQDNLPQGALEVYT